MGEIAEMMLDGTLCEMCGVFLGEPQGFPGYCSSECAKDRGADECQVIRGEFEETDDLDNIECLSLEGVLSDIDTAISFLEISADELLALKKPKKSKSLLGLIKNIKIFKESLK